MSSAADSRLVIGVGHAARRDDGVGPYVARCLAERGLPAVAHEGDGSGLLDLWESRPACIAVDAVAGTGGAAGAPGTIHIFDDFDDPAFRRADFVHSSHRFGLPEAVALGRELGRLPARLIILGITGADFGFGESLSPAVARAADRMIERLAAEEPFGPDVMDALKRGRF